MGENGENIELVNVNEKVDDLVKTIKNLRYLVGFLVAMIVAIFMAGFAAYPHVEAWKQIRTAHDDAAVGVINREVPVIPDLDGYVLRTELQGYVKICDLVTLVNQVAGSEERHLWGHWRPGDADEVRLEPFVARDSSLVWQIRGASNSC